MKAWSICLPQEENKVYQAHIITTHSGEYCFYSLKLWVSEPSLVKVESRKLDKDEKAKWAGEPADPDFPPSQETTQMKQSSYKTGAVDDPSAPTLHLLTLEGRNCTNK